MIHTFANYAAMRRLEQFEAEFQRLDFETAYACVTDAILADPIFAWHQIVRHYSLSLYTVVKQLSPLKRTQLTALLGRLHRSHPGMICVPPDERAESQTGATMARRAAIDKGLPYFLFVAQGKSGSVAFGNIVPRGFGLPCVTYATPSSTVIPTWAADCARGGGAYVTHLPPSTENIVNLKTAGLTKLIVHTRDPRQILVSLIHHHERYRSQFPHLERSGYYALSFGDRARSLIDVFDDCVGWLSGWLAAAASGALQILFTCFADFVTRPADTLSRVLSFYGGERQHFDGAAGVPP